MHDVTNPIIKKPTIKPFVKDNIKISAEIKTDEFKSYKSLKKLGYNHDTVDHGRKQFVKGKTHTNNLGRLLVTIKKIN